MFLSLVWSHIDNSKAGIQSCSDTGQSMSQRIVNFSGQTVPFSGLSHPFGHICIFFQLLIGCLKLVVELIDFFNGTTLHINNINAVDDKQNNIQRNDNIENAEQILLRTGRIISDVV